MKNWAGKAEFILDPENSAPNCEKCRPLVARCQQIHQVFALTIDLSLQVNRVKLMRPFIQHPDTITHSVCESRFIKIIYFTYGLH